MYERDEEWKKLSVKKGLSQTLKTCRSIGRRENKKRTLQTVTLFFNHPGPGYGYR